MSTPRISRPAVMLEFDLFSVGEIKEAPIQIFASPWAKETGTLEIYIVRRDANTMHDDDVVAYRAQGGIEIRQVTE